MSKCEPGCQCGRHFHTEEHRRKLSEAQTGLDRRGQQGHKCPEGCTCKKHIRTEEHSEALRRSLLGKYRAGLEGCWNTRVEKYRSTRTVFDCDICGLPEFKNSKKRHHVDHCHETDIIRGILCSGCNGHLGIWIQISDFFKSWIDTEWEYPLDSLKFRELQEIVCQWCSVEPPKRIHVDHNHKTGKIRGLLCYRCNRTLGWYENWTEEIELYLKQAALEVVRDGS